MTESRKNKFYIALALTLPLLCLAMLFYFRPFWGLMDDSTNLTIVDSMNKEGVLPVWWKLSTTDLFSHGRLRGLYFATIALIYLPAGASSVTAFTLNIIFLSAIFFFAAAAFWHSARAAFDLKTRHAFLLAFVSLSFAYPWTVYAIRAPSVQEKIVLLFAALTLWVQYRCDRNSLLIWAACTSLALAVSVNTKETIALFFPIFLAAQLELDSARRNYRRTMLLLVFLLALTLMIKWAGTHGTYKAAYGMDRALQTLRQSKSLYLFLALAFGAGLASLLDFASHKNFPRFAVAASFPIGLLLFLVLMIPWGLGGYLNCSATVFVVMCLIGISNFLGRRIAFFRALSPRMYLGAAYLAAVTVLFIRLRPDYSAYADLRNVLFSPQIDAVADQGKTLWMPCNEGAGTVEHYLQRFRGLRLITRMPGTNPTLAFSAGQYWLSSPGNCSGAENIGDWISRGEAETVIAPGLKGGYTLVRRLKAP